MCAPCVHMSVHFTKTGVVFLDPLTKKRRALANPIFVSLNKLVSGSQIIHETISDLTCIKIIKASTSKAPMHQQRASILQPAMEISQQLLLYASLLLLFAWLLLRQASPRKRSNGQGGRQIPSPPALPFLGHLHLLKTKPLHRSLAALATRYGDGSGLLHLRFGAKRVLLVTSPSVADECFTVHDVALADRPGLASRRALTRDCPAIAMCSYGPLWRQLRRLATVHALCAHRLAATSGARDAEARAMAAELWRRAGAGAGTVAVKAAAYEFAANVVMAMVAGTRMTGDQVRRFREMTEAGLAAAGAANRHDSLPVLRLLDFGRTRRRLAGIAEARRQFGQSILDDYRRRRQRHPGGADDDAGETAARTVLGDLLRQQEEEEQSPEHLDDVVIRSVCLVSQLDLVRCTITRQRVSSGGRRRIHGRRRRRHRAAPNAVDVHRTGHYNYYHFQKAPIDYRIVPKIVQCEVAGMYC